MHIRFLSNLHSPIPGERPKILHKFHHKQASGVFFSRNSSKESKPTFLKLSNVKSDFETFDEGLTGSSGQSTYGKEKDRAKDFSSHVQSFFCGKPTSSFIKDSNLSSGPQLSPEVVHKYLAKADQLSNNSACSTGQICDVFEGLFTDLGQSLPQYMKLFNHMKQLAAGLREHDVSPDTAMSSDSATAGTGGMSGCPSPEEARRIVIMAGMNPKLSLSNASSPKNELDEKVKSTAIDSIGIKGKLRISAVKVVSRRNLGAALKGDITNVKSMSPVELSPLKKKPVIPKLNLRKVLQQKCWDEFMSRTKEASVACKGNAQQTKTHYYK